MYSSWDMVFDRYDYFSFILDHFLPFYPPNSPKNQTLKKKKKNTSRDHQFTYVLQKLWSDGVWFLRYGAWQIWLFFILDHFCPFNPLTTVQKIKILKKWKTFFEILSFYICVPIIMVRWCMVPEIWCMTDVIVVSHFGLVFTILLPSTPPPSAPNSPKNQYFEKMKKHLEISSFYICKPYIICLRSDDIWFLRYGAQQIDGQTDRRTDEKSGT